jgi:hypothetical protein
MDGIAMLSTRRVGIAVAIGLLALWPVSGYAQVAPPAPALACQQGEYPEFNDGFLALAAALHGTMGGPISCAYADPKGTGDTLQQTTGPGLAFWRKSTNTPTFTDGVQHWALTERGLVTWTGTSIDPPADALAGAGGGDPASYRAYCDRLESDEARAETPICQLIDQP